MTEQQLRWHLHANVMPALTEKTIDGIIGTWQGVQAGELQLTDNINGSNVSIGEMFEDLKIEV